MASELAGSEDSGGVDGAVAAYGPTCGAIEESGVVAEERPGEAVLVEFAGGTVASEVAAAAGGADP